MCEHRGTISDPDHSPPVRGWPSVPAPPPVHQGTRPGRGPTCPSTPLHPEGARAASPTPRPPPDKASAPSCLPSPTGGLLPWGHCPTCHPPVFQRPPPLAQTQWPRPPGSQHDPLPPPPRSASPSTLLGLPGPRTRSGAPAAAGPPGKTLRTHLSEPLAHEVLPAVLGGRLGDEEPVGPRGQGGHQGQVPGGAAQRRATGGHRSPAASPAPRRDTPRPAHSSSRKSAPAALRAPGGAAPTPAPQRPPRRAPYPQCRPITSSTKVLWWLWTDRVGSSALHPVDGPHGPAPQTASGHGSRACCPGPSPARETPGTERVPGQPSSPGTAGSLPARPSHPTVGPFPLICSPAAGH